MGATLRIPDIAKSKVSKPNPPINAPAMGMIVSAIRGESHRHMMTTTNNIVIRKPSETNGAPPGNVYGIESLTAVV